LTREKISRSIDYEADALVSSHLSSLHSSYQARTPVWRMYEWNLVI